MTDAEQKVIATARKVLAGYTMKMGSTLDATNNPIPHSNAFAIRDLAGAIEELDRK